MKIHRDYVFTFGKYKGRPYLDVVKHDPDYVLWCAENIEWFELSEAEIRLILLSQPHDLCTNLDDAWPTPGLRSLDAVQRYRDLVDEYYGQEPTVRWEADTGMGGDYAIEYRTYPDGRIERREHSGMTVTDGKPDYGPWWQ